MFSNFPPSQTRVPNYYVDGGPSGGSSVSRPGSGDPHQREQNFCVNVLTSLSTNMSSQLFHLTCYSTKITKIAFQLGPFINSELEKQDGSQTSTKIYWFRIHHHVFPWAQLGCDKMKEHRKVHKGQLWAWLDKVGNLQREESSQKGSYRSTVGLIG